MTAPRICASGRDVVAEMRRRQQPMSSCCGEPHLAETEVSPGTRRAARLTLAAVVVALVVLAWLVL